MFRTKKLLTAEIAEDAEKSKFEYQNGKLLTAQERQGQSGRPLDA